MTNFPFGLIALIVISILIYFGVAHRVLDRMRLTDKGALAVIAAIIIGSFFDIPIGSSVTINLGALAVIGLAIYVFIKAGTIWEKTRALIAAVITAMVLFLAARFLGAEPEDIFIDPIYIYPLVAGVVGYLAGRSRRGAFFAAVIGVLSVDVTQFIWLNRTGLQGTVAIGGGGAFDSLVVAGILAVLLAETIGEVLERISGGPQTDGRPEELLKNLREPEAARKPLPQKDEEAGNEEGGNENEEK
ncbi:MAG TPA: DUF1614 domain-containing protein [Syntrophomonadaceae bacterium]|nr:DUF1614 domain-containing protein [Syntrophomonadaceae bacterium]